jgi:hypothetical protein
MTSSTGQVRTGLLGDSFAFTAPNFAGELLIDADFTINGQLRNQTGIVVNGSLQLQAGKFILHNEYGPDFDLNLAKDLAGRDSDFLFDQEFPEGGLNIGPPIYLFDSTFALGGFDVEHAQYRIQVIPVPATLHLLALGLLTLASLRTRRKWFRRTTRRSIAREN